MHRNNKKSNPVVFAGFILLEYKVSYNQGILHKENYGNYLSREGEQNHNINNSDMTTNMGSTNSFKGQYLSKHD